MLSSYIFITYLPVELTLFSLYNDFLSLETVVNLKSVSSEISIATLFFFDYHLNVISYLPHTALPSLSTYISFKSKVNLLSDINKMAE